MVWVLTGLFSGFKDQMEGLVHAKHIFSGYLSRFLILVKIVKF